VPRVALFTLVTAPFFFVEARPGILVFAAWTPILPPTLLTSVLPGVAARVARRMHARVLAPLKIFALLLV
jgi:hypothetical protein